MKNRRRLFLIFFLLFCTASVLAPFYFLQQNIVQQNIASGFHFLTQESGFEISESLISYDSFMSYGRALVVGLSNTLYVALIGNIMAFTLGIFLGVFSLSKNYLLSKLCSVYLNFFRNIPLLLQLFFWYGIFTDVLPPVKKSLSFLGMLISNRGISMPWFSGGEGLLFFLISVFCSVGASFVIYQWFKKSKVKGHYKNILPVLFFLFLQAAMLEFIIRFSPIDYPAVKGFNVRGGVNFSPELISLIFGLVLYTAAFMGEIVRSGILAVSKGQWEAAYSLGLTKTQALRKIILPQSFNVALPPMTAQFLNLTKNSSLAVAIGYPDFVSVANTTMNQTGQAVELVLLIMGLYLTISLSVSFVANLINRKLTREGI